MLKDRHGWGAWVFPTEPCAHLSALDEFGIGHDLYETRTVVVSAARLTIGHFPKTSTAEIVISSLSVVALCILSTCKVRVARAIPSAALRSDGFLTGIGAAQALVILAGTAAARRLSWH